MKKVLISIIFISVSLMGCFDSKNLNDEVKNKNNDEEVKELINSAMKYQDEDNLKMAAKKLEEALKIKEDACVLVSLGSAYLRACDFENAIVNFQKAVKKKEELNLYDYVVAMLGIANAQVMSDRYNDSFNTLMKLQKEIPLSDIPEDKKIDMISGIAKAKWRIGKYEEAIEDFKTAISIDNRGYLYVGLSRVRAAMGDFEGAKKDCLKAVSIEDSRRTRVGLAEAKEHLGDLAGAINEYKTALTKKSMGTSIDEINFEKKHINECLDRLESEMQNKNNEQ